MKNYPRLWVTVVCVLTGVWEKPDHESQGIVLQIIDQADDSNVGVAYWFTYATDLESAWFLAVGEAEFVMDYDDTAFTVHLKNLALGSYSLNVMGEEKAVFEVVEEDEGEVKLKFTGPFYWSFNVMMLNPNFQCKT